MILKQTGLLMSVDISPSFWENPFASNNTKALEHEIYFMVYALYGLSDKDIEIFENS